jgi:hypothetical protein
MAPCGGPALTAFAPKVGNFVDGRASMEPWPGSRHLLPT